MKKDKTFITFEVVEQNGTKYIFISSDDWLLTPVLTGNNIILAENKLKGLPAQGGPHPAKP